MNRTLRSVLARSLVLAVGIAGCNTLLDNKPGTLDAATRKNSSPTEPVSDGGLPVVQKDGEPTEDAGLTSGDAEAGSPCPPGRRVCHGVCVELADPAYGCGDPACQPCKTAHGTATCQSNECSVKACDKGFADCNHKPDDGCEADLSQPNHCGGCNTPCAAAAPICAPSSDSFQCTTGCSPDAPLLCGNECVSPQTSVNHCGGCNKKCADVANANVACASGACTFECKAGFGNCNHDATDGCEVNLATDPLHCGACGTPCQGNCVDAMCTPLPNPDANP